MINIKMNEFKVAKMKEFCEDRIKEILSSPYQDDCDIDYMKFLEERTKCKDFSDLFYEYEDTMKVFSKEYSTIVSDDMNIDNSKFIFSDNPNSHYCVEAYSDYRLENIYMFKNTNCNIPFGVCDNASQILKRYQPKDDEVVIMFPVIKEYEPERGGWRWHEWGPYIGVHKHHCEYLSDEKDIDVVFCFSIYKIVANK